MADPSHDGAKKVRSDGPSELAKAEERTALWLLIPTFSLIIAFYRLGRVCVESFRQREFASGNPGTWVGFQNYQQLLAVTLRQLPVELGDDGNPVVEDGEVQSRTVSIAIALFTGEVARQEPFGELMAAAVIVTILLVVLVLLFQNRIVEGLTAGSVKG